MTIRSIFESGLSTKQAITHSFRHLDKRKNWKGDVEKPSIAQYTQGNWG